MCHGPPARRVLLLGCLRRDTLAARRGPLGLPQGPRRRRSRPLIAHCRCRHCCRGVHHREMQVQAVLAVRLPSGRRFARLHRRGRCAKTATPRRLAHGRAQRLGDGGADSTVARATHHLSPSTVAWQLYGSAALRMGLATALVPGPDYPDIRAGIREPAKPCHAE